MDSIINTLTQTGLKPNEAEVVLKYMQVTWSRLLLSIYNAHINSKTKYLWKTIKQQFWPTEMKLSGLKIKFDNRRTLDKLSELRSKVWKQMCSILNSKFKDASVFKNFFTKLATNSFFKVGIPQRFLKNYLDRLNRYLTVHKTDPGLQFTIAFTNYLHMILLTANRYLKNHRAYNWRRGKYVKENLIEALTENVSLTELKRRLYR